VPLFNPWRTVQLSPMLRIIIALLDLLIMQLGDIYRRAGRASACPAKRHSNPHEMGKEDYELVKTKSHSLLGPSAACPSPDGRIRSA
jgi:hypothetical protein